MLDTEQMRTTGITEMSKPDHPEGVEGSTPFHYPSPEEIGRLHAIMEEFKRRGFITPIVNENADIPPYQLTSEDLEEIQAEIDELTKPYEESDDDEQT